MKKEEWGLRIGDWGMGNGESGCLRAEKAYLGSCCCVKNDTFFYSYLFTGVPFRKNTFFFLFFLLSSQPFSSLASHTPSQPNPTHSKKFIPLFFFFFFFRERGCVCVFCLLVRFEI